MSDPLTHLVLPLRGGCWDRLLILVTTPSTRVDGGWQSRKRKWTTRINEAAKSIELDPDDIDFIRRQIINHKNGGFQQQFYDIFAGQHAQFSRLPIAPRKKPADRKHRGQPSFDDIPLPLAAKPKDE